MQILVENKTHHFGSCLVKGIQEIDHEVVSTVIDSSLPLIQERFLSVTSKSMCTQKLVNRFKNFAQKHNV